MKALALVLLLLAADTSAAHGPGRPDLFGKVLLGAPADVVPSGPQRGLVGASGHSVPYGPSCDLAELLATSRAWVTMNPPLVTRDPTLATLSIYIPDTRTPAQKLRAEADALARRELADQRWRRAVAACSP